MIYKKAEVRKAGLLEVAVELASKKDYLDVTRREIGLEANVAQSLVHHYFGTMDALRDEIVQAAVDKSIVKIIAYAMVHGHPAVEGASDVARGEAAKILASGTLR